MGLGLLLSRLLIWLRGRLLNRLLGRLPKRLTRENSGHVYRGLGRLLGLLSGLLSRLLTKALLRGLLAEALSGLLQRLLGLLNLAETLRGLLAKALLGGLLHRLLNRLLSRLLTKALLGRLLSRLLYRDLLYRDLVLGRLAKRLRTRHAGEHLGLVTFVSLHDHRHFRFIHIADRAEFELGIGGGLVEGHTENDSIVRDLRQSAQGGAEVAQGCGGYCKAKHLARSLSGTHHGDELLVATGFGLLACLRVDLGPKLVLRAAGAGVALQVGAIHTGGDTVIAGAVGGLGVLVRVPRGSVVCLVQPWVDVDEDQLQLEDLERCLCLPAYDGEAPAGDAYMIDGLPTDAGGGLLVDVVITDKRLKVRGQRCLLEGDHFVTHQVDSFGG